MIRRISAVSLALVLSLVATNASARGPQRNYAPYDCGATPWAGPYIGAAAGYASQRTEITDVLPLSPTFGSKLKDSDGSATFGGYTGYSWQCDSLVFGIETDFNYLGTSPSAVDGTQRLESNIDWYGTIRGRVGFSIHDSLLLYATGGLAYANVDHTFSDANVAGAFGPFSQSNGGTKTGWTFGGGVEHLHHTRWLLRAEAFYVDLGSETHNYTVPACPFPCQLALDWDDTFWVGRFGLTYKFGADAPPVPLK